jgi:hypothetical protein
MSLIYVEFLQSKNEPPTASSTVTSELDQKAIEEFKDAFRMKSIENALL